jgi:bifunctional DNA-binding transcriptional regulator/antitoxin component of YhaV-PrlF toxin-antitoxin module
METEKYPTNVVTLDPEGKVTLPKGVLKNSGLGSGDLLFVTELSGDTILLKRLDPAKSALDLLKELGAALAAAGYDTTARIDELVDEAKRETTTEWLTKVRVSRDASS